MSLPKVQNRCSDYHGGRLLVPLQFTIPLVRKKYTRRVVGCIIFRESAVIPSLGKLDAVDDNSSPRMFGRHLLIKVEISVPIVRKKHTRWLSPGAFLFTELLGFIAIEHFFLEKPGHDLRNLVAGSLLTTILFCCV